jgi:hypothetical protein
MIVKVIYTAIAVDLPLWAVKAIEKILRGFLWKGRKEAKGGRGGDIVCYHGLKLLGQKS